MTIGKGDQNWPISLDVIYEQPLSYFDYICISIYGLFDLIYASIPQTPKSVVIFRSSEDHFSDFLNFYILIIKASKKQLLQLKF